MSRFLEGHESMHTVTAYVDECEAVHAGHSYSMAASLIDESRADEISDVIHSLTLAGHSKLHWYDEHKAARRTLLAQAVADLDAVEHLVVVLSAAPVGTRPERRRRQCLTRLFPELHELGVARAMMEARETKQNRRDVDLLLGLRQRRLITGPFRIDHVPGPVQPLLAVADIVAGAVMAAYAGEPVYRKILAPKLTELVI